MTFFRCYVKIDLNVWKSWGLVILDEWLTDRAKNSLSIWVIDRFAKFESFILKLVENYKFFEKLLLASKCVYDVGIQSWILQRFSLSSEKVFLHDLQFLHYFWFKNNEIFVPTIKFVMNSMKNGLDIASKHSNKF